MYYLGWLELRSAVSGYVQGHRPSALNKRIYQMKIYHSRIQKRDLVVELEALNELKNYSIYRNVADLSLI